MEIKRNPPKINRILHVYTMYVHTYTHIYMHVYYKYIYMYTHTQCL